MDCSFGKFESRSFCHFHPESDWAVHVNLHLIARTWIGTIDERRANVELPLHVKWMIWKGANSDEVPIRAKKSKIKWNIWWDSESASADTPFRKLLISWLDALFSIGECFGPWVPSESNKQKKLKTNKKRAFKTIQSNDERQAKTMKVFLFSIWCR